jgi:hypothetical protein|uniref:Uncharacterized protein n=1 Tax=Picea sitchensis TaxID=3332 RepID=A0A6B9XTI3_PICSI|nr:hypothetical protein Q903MT_gene4386 [Picea sitchensis]
MCLSLGGARSKKASFSHTYLDLPPSIRSIGATDLVSKTTESASEGAGGRNYLLSMSGRATIWRGEYGGENGNF